MGAALEAGVVASLALVVAAAAVVVSTEAAAVVSGSDVAVVGTVAPPSPDGLLPAVVAAVVPAGVVGG